MSNKMPNAPVLYALGLVRFSPIEKMTTFYADFQESLRLTGLTEFSALEQMNVQVTFEKESVNTSRSSEPLWIYSNIERTEGYLLSKDFLCFHTTSYETHEPFLDKLISGLKLLDSVASIRNVIRLGLRYIDVAIPSSNESNEIYLYEGFNKIPNFGKSLMTTTEAFLELETRPVIPKGKMIARVHSVHGQPLGLPNDLSLHGLVLLPKFVKSNQPTNFVMLDVDHSVEGPMSLESIQLRDRKSTRLNSSHLDLSRMPSSA